MGKWFWFGKREGDPPPVTTIHRDFAWKPGKGPKEPGSLVDVTEWVRQRECESARRFWNNVYRNGLTRQPKETPMTRKLVIEYNTGDGQWNTAGGDCTLNTVAQAVNELGTQDCPDVHRHLDKYCQIHARQGNWQYRWRIVEEKPAGRAARRGDIILHSSGARGAVIGGYETSLEVVCTSTSAGEGRPGIIRWARYHDFVHTDSVPVTGYDPS